MLNLTRNIGIVILSLLLHFYFYGSEHIKKIDYTFYDYTAKMVDSFSKKENSSYVVIIDIDERSIQRLGQWPWPRVLDAELIKRIHAMNPSALGLNILFPEKDRLSPLSLQEFYSNFFNLKIELNQLPLNLQDNDKLLSEVIENSETTLSFYFQNTQHMATQCQEMSYKNNIFASIDTKLSANSLLCNHSSIQDEMKNFGFINAWRDSDGIFRRIPLFMRYKKEVFPSFALATLLSFDQYVKIEEKEDVVLLNFLKHKPKVFSAVDVLDGNILDEEIQGKIVIIGSSVVGLNPRYTLYNGKSISSSLIHAFVIDNILTESLLVHPEYFKSINIVFAFLFSIFFVFLFSRKKYLEIFFLFIFIFIFSTFLLLYAYINGIYISMAYLLLPILYSFVFILLYHMRSINHERREQEKLFIRQSKLASMGEMISLIAHQWRQPLSSINGTVLNLDVDYRNKKLDMKRLEIYLNEIENTTAYLSRTITDFTDFFSKSKVAERFPLSSVIVQAKHLSAISLTDDVEVIYRTQSDIKISGYSSELVQSVLVLLNNAIYVCQENLEVTRKGNIFIDVFQVGKNAVISVEDNGGGVSKKNMKQIFNPYFTTKEKHNGTGLGLYILKLIVEDSMNGKVSLTNGTDGAIFSIEVPMNTE